MKRKWMLLLAAVPLIVGLVWAKRLADKRPRLIMRGVPTLTLTISPDGKKALMNGNQVVNLSNGSRITISGDVSSRNFFSPDGKRICQINSERESPQSESYHEVLVLVDSESGQRQGAFSFAHIPNIYGVCWRGDEIIAESPSRTLIFETRSLHLIRTQKRHRKDWDGALCPDGETIVVSRGMWYEPHQFFDLNTGKLLWRLPEEAVSGSLRFSMDGLAVLTQKNGEVTARDTRTGKEIWRLRGPQSDVLALSPDQKIVYEARSNGELWKWPR